jgi:hypothetical protein
VSACHHDDELAFYVVRYYVPWTCKLLSCCVLFATFTVAATNARYTRNVSDLFRVQVSFSNAMIFDVTQQHAVLVRLVDVMTKALSVIKLCFIERSVLIPDPARSDLLNKPMSIPIAHNVPVVRRVSDY